MRFSVTCTQWNIFQSIKLTKTWYPLRDQNVFQMQYVPPTLHVCSQWWFHCNPIPPSSSLHFLPCEFQNISFINLQFFTLDNMTVVLPLLVQRQFYMMAILFTYQLGSIVLVSLSMIAIYSWINYLIISLCCCMNTNGYNGSPITRLLHHRGRSVGVCALLQLCVPLEKSSPALQVHAR